MNTTRELNPTWDALFDLKQLLTRIHSLPCFTGSPMEQGQLLYLACLSISHYYKTRN